ncbi:hypothetical protein AB0J82_36640 [Asanoa sp. NPDC049518]|uniref:hypothetical protein n=1 Tax=unclassified Asanoa TaxID=2685164 RepID=UPI0034192B55
MFGPDFVSGIQDSILGWLATAILACFDALIAVITDVLLVTPDVTTLPQVQALTGRSMLVVDAVYVLAFVAAGVMTMIAGGDAHSCYTAKDLLPRLVVGFVAAHFCQLWCHTMINLANALTAALTTPSSTAGGRPGAVAGIRAHLAVAHQQDAALLFVVCAAIIVVLLAATAFSMIVRFAVVLVLTAAAPLALACHALPQTDPVARMWWRAYLGTLAVPVAQGFTLYAGQWMLTDPTHMLPALGLPAEPGGVINLFVVMVLLWITVKIPNLMRRYVLAAGPNRNPMGALMRVVVVQQLTRALPGVGRAVRAVTP